MMTQRLGEQHRALNKAGNTKGEKNGITGDRSLQWSLDTVQWVRSTYMEIQLDKLKPAPKFPHSLMILKSNKSRRNRELSLRLAGFV